MIVLTHRSYADVANGSLELDQWVSAVVTITWAGLAIAAEVRVVADSTLVAGAHNVLALVLAERTIAVDTDMAMAC